MSVDVLEPRVWCNPVEKTVGEEVWPMVDPDQHLACYDINPKVDWDQQHGFVDQFGAWPLNVREDLLLCVPSYKTIIHEKVPSVNAWGLAALSAVLLALAAWLVRSRMSSSTTL
ncbi:MAG: hypothetical protein JRH16_07865 [Deltaproteobacteria bacterium]|nr:hypothetical protein [Deltaproteobacteria bacterium]